LAPIEQYSRKSLKMTKISNEAILNILNKLLPFKSELLILQNFSNWKSLFEIANTT